MKLLKFRARGISGSFFTSPLSLMIMALTTTLLLSYGAASIAGKNFVGTDLFNFILKKIMQLDGVTAANPRDFLNHLGLYGWILCIFLCLSLGFFVYLLGLISLWLGSAGYSFLQRLRPRRKELPTEGIPDEQLFHSRE